MQGELGSAIHFASDNGRPTVPKLTPLIVPFRAYYRLPGHNTIFGSFRMGALSRNWHGSRSVVWTLGLRTSILGHANLCGQLETRNRHKTAHLAPIPWQNRDSMGHRLPQELLDELRSYLEHFDQTGHLGETDTVAEIKRRLRTRIAEVESELKIRRQKEDSPSHPSD